MKKIEVMEDFDKSYLNFNEKFDFNNDFNAQFEEYKRSFMSKLIETEYNLKTGLFYNSFLLI
jgi:hypothetical protein